MADPCNSARNRTTTSCTLPTIHGCGSADSGHVNFTLLLASLIVTIVYKSQRCNCLQDKGNDVCSSKLLMKNEAPLLVKKNEKKWKTTWGETFSANSSRGQEGISLKIGYPYTQEPQFNGQNFRQTPCNHPHSVSPSICQFVATAEAQFNYEFWVLKWPSIRLKVFLFHPIARYPWEFKLGCHGFSWRGNHSGQAIHVFQVFVSAQGRICRWWHFRLDRNDARCACKHGEQGSPFLWNGQFIYKSLHCHIWFPEGSSLILCLHFCFTSRLPVHLRHRLRCDIRYEDSGVGSPEDLWPLITSRFLSNRQLWKLRRLPPASERKKHVSCSRDARKEREKDGQVETLRVFLGRVETCDTRYTIFGHPATCIYMPAILMFRCFSPIAMRQDVWCKPQRLKLLVSKISQLQKFSVVLSQYRTLLLWNHLV